MIIKRLSGLWKWLRRQNQPAPSIKNEKVTRKRFEMVTRGSRQRCCLGGAPGGDDKGQSWRAVLGVLLEVAIKGLGRKAVSVVPREMVKSGWGVAKTQISWKKWWHVSGEDGSKDAWKSEWCLVESLPRGMADMYLLWLLFSGWLKVKETHACPTCEES